MSLNRLRAAAVLSVLTLGLGLGTALTAGTADAAVTAQPSVAAGSIFGPCPAVSDGNYQFFGHTLYECRYVPGFGGYYWISVASNSCPGATPASREASPAVKVCS